MVVFDYSYTINSYYFISIKCKFYVWLLAKEEFDDSVVVDHTFEEDNNKSEEEEVTDETPKKKGRPGRKKGKYL